jgi:hypothetical protein
MKVIGLILLVAGLCAIDESYLDGRNHDSSSRFVSSHGESHKSLCGGSVEAAQTVERDAVNLDSTG